MEKIALFDEDCKMMDVAFTDFFPKFGSLMTPHLMVLTFKDDPEMSNPKVKDVRGLLISGRKSGDRPDTRWIFDKLNAFRVRYSKTVHVKASPLGTEFKTSESWEVYFKVELAVIGDFEEVLDKINIGRLEDVTREVRKRFGL